MARRVLSQTRTGHVALLAIALTAIDGCRRGEQRATPQASASASAYAESARASHFEAELTRARARFKAKPSLGDCGVIAQEKDDLELCEAASSALGALEEDPDAPVERALPLLENSALTLARLSKRVRFLSLSELSKKRMAGDAGAPAPSAAAPKHGPAAADMRRQREPGHRTFELSDGPISRLMGTSVHLERDVVRNLGAYLEYAELPVRRSAFATVKRLREQHPQWPLLTQLLREAALLEADPELKGQLTNVTSSGLPSNPPKPHSADSK